MNALQATKKLAQEQVVDRLDPRTTRPEWVTPRNILLGVALIGSAFIPGPQQIVTIPATATKLVSFVVWSSGMLSGYAWFDKKGKKAK